jgi:hypothetical protein
MKNTILFLSISLLSFFSFGQNISFTDLDTNKGPKGTFESYTSQTGDVYKVGDTLRIGVPSSSNGNFLYLQSLDIAGNSLPVRSNVSNTNAEIKKIRVAGSKRAGWKVTFQLKATAVSNYFIFAEDGFSSGELVSFGMTSDQALQELKRAKDKLDLGIITQEEYDTIKSKLLKYIK